jgi:hypothetical protein
MANPSKIKILNILQLHIRIIFPNAPYNYIPLSLQYNPDPAEFGMITPQALCYATDPSSY